MVFIRFNCRDCERTKIVEVEEEEAKHLLPNSPYSKSKVLKCDYCERETSHRVRNRVESV